jgi:hypothetical protein
VLNPVHAVLPGRRNNPADGVMRPLAVFGPIHYQELPELFMDFVASLTGKSPSTTGPQPGLRLRFAARDQRSPPRRFPRRKPCHRHRLDPLYHNPPA